MGPFDEMIPRLQELVAVPWVRQVGLLVAVALVTWLPAKGLAAWLQRRRPEAEPRSARVLRDLLEAALWPILAMGFLAVALQVWLRVAEQPLEDPYRVLPILVFFLLYRIVSSLMKSLMARSDKRRRLRRVIVPFVMLLIVLQQLHLLGPVIAWMQRPLFDLGGVALSLFSVLGSVLVVLAFIVFGRVLGHVLAHRALPSMGFDLALSEAVATVIRYTLVVIGAMVGLSTMGFDLTSIQIVFGALGVGIGFGLQTIVNNFVSGLILLFERTVKRGDVLTVEGTDGRVQSIGLRASVLRTRGGDDIVMPNSNLVSNPVTNYSLRDRLKRCDVDVGVSYGSDPNQVSEILLQATEQIDGLLKNPPPTVLFMAFGSSSLDFQLRVWIDDAWRLPQVRSELLFKIWYLLKDAGVEIPFPQRDLHIRSGVLPVRQLEAEE